MSRGAYLTKGAQPSLHMSKTCWAWIHCLDIFIIRVRAKDLSHHILRCGVFHGNVPIPQTTADRASPCLQMSTNKEQRLNSDIILHTCCSEGTRT